MRPCFEILLMSASLVCSVSYCSPATAQNFNPSLVFLTWSAANATASDLVPKSETLDNFPAQSTASMPSFVDDCKAEIKEHCGSNASSDGGTDDLQAFEMDEDPASCSAAERSEWNTGKT